MNTVAQHTGEEHILLQYFSASVWQHSACGPRTAAHGPDVPQGTRAKQLGRTQLHGGKPSSRTAWSGFPSSRPCPSQAATSALQGSYIMM